MSQTFTLMEGLRKFISITSAETLKDHSQQVKTQKWKGTIDCSLSRGKEAVWYGCGFTYLYAFSSAE